jgi:peptidoglycan/LPS O-acetylase OafA/YrhL
MKRLKIIVWSLLALLFIVLVVRNSSYNMFSVDLLIHWTFRLISFSAVVCIVWYFSGVFIKKVKFKVLTVLLFVLICAVTYTITHYHPKVVQMEEDVLYIKPMPKK